MELGADYIDVELKVCISSMFHKLSKLFFNFFFYSFSIKPLNSSAMDMIYELGIVLVVIIITYD